jgi:titin
MKSRVVSKALGLLVMFVVVACGGGDTPPPSPRAPGAPTGVTAVPGDAQATVSWTAPADNGGSEVVEYVVRASRNGVEVPPQRSSSPSLTVTGLANGEPHTFTVSAVNSVGEGPRSAASAAVIPRVVPGAPRNVSATPGDRQATVTWEPPEENGMAITGYTVQVHKGNELVATQSASGLSATVSNLENGTGYLVSVLASNAVVPGSASAPVAVTPRTVPGAPVVSSEYPAMEGTTEAVPVTLRWTVPETGGSPITGYSVSVREGDQVLLSEETTATEVTFTRLTNGTVFSATVVARNAAGPGASSTYSRKLCGYIGAPQRFRGVAGERQVSLTWQPPLDLAGCNLTGYQVTVLALTAPEPPSQSVWHTSNTSIAVTGLLPGHAYLFSIQAGTDEGPDYVYGDSGNDVTVTPYTAPLPPTQFNATPGDGMVELSWSGVQYQGSTPQGFRITVTPAEVATITLDRFNSFYRVTGLTNGTSYTFSLVVLSNAGESTPVTVQATPQAP